MRPGLVLLPLLLGFSECAMTATAWFSHPGTQGTKLALLPFALEDVLQPGETRDIFLFDDSLTAALKSSATNYDCLGGMLFNEEGEPFDLAMLLEVEEVKVDRFCSWARLRCVSRCKLTSIKSTRGTIIASPPRPYTRTSATTMMPRGMMGVLR